MLFVGFCRGFEGRATFLTYTLVYSRITRVSQGVVTLPGTDGETATQGLTDLHKRCQRYYEAGARFVSFLLSQSVCSYHFDQPICTCCTLYNETTKPYETHD